MEPTLDGIEPIPLRKTLLLVNNFIVNTVDYMNKFVVLCERKLATTTHSLQRVETVLTLLEAKLSSIDWLAGNAPAVDRPAADASITIGSSSSGGADGAAASAPIDGATAPVQAGGAAAAGAVPAAAPAAAAATAAAAETAPAQEQASAAAPVCLLKNDPRYEGYFRMVRMGVPKVVVATKMTAEGVDADIIELDPDAPTPAHLGPPPTVAADDDDDDASSDEPEGMSDSD